jgi:hypothetical protein
MLNSKLGGSLKNTDASKATESKISSQSFKPTPVDGLLVETAFTGSDGNFAQDLPQAYVPCRSSTTQSRPVGEPGHPGAFDLKYFKSWRPLYFTQAAFTGSDGNFAQELSQALVIYRPLAQLHRSICAPLHLKPFDLKHFRRFPSSRPLYFLYDSEGFRIQPNPRSFESFGHSPWLPVSVGEVVIPAEPGPSCLLPAVVI